MATIRKRGEAWQAIVDLRGVYKAKTFPLKSQAKIWANSLELEITNGDFINPTKRTISHLLDAYEKKVSVNKKGHRWESIRIDLIKRLPIPLGSRIRRMGDIHLDDFDEKFAAAYRDTRLETVSGSTVVREIHILSHAFNTARKEWKWVKSNPFSSIKKPAENPPRNRLARPEEIQKLIYASGYKPTEAPKTTAQRVMAAWLYASFTGKRCKEITRLTRNMVHLEEHYVEVGHDSKTGARQVPLLKEAEAILENILALGLDPVFGLTESQVDANWRKNTKKAMVENLTFHDSKHQACTWMASEKKIQVQDLARIVGTRDLRTLMVYYNPTATEIAKRYA